MLDYSKAISETTKVSAAGFMPMLGALTPAACLGSWNTAAFRTGGEIAESWLKFVGERLAKDADLPREVTNCENVNDLIVLYNEYWQQTAKDYAAEFSKIFNATWAAGKNIWGVEPDAYGKVQRTSSTN